MLVLKFGGTSVGSAENMRKVANIILSESTSKIVVLSAMSGTTNNLVKIVSQIKNEENSGAVLEVEQMHMKYLEVIDELFYERNYFVGAEVLLKNIFSQLLS
ncbi:MAG: aspartate kinase, partial [Bacteroidota bacterium]